MILSTRVDIVILVLSNAFGSSSNALIIFVEKSKVSFSL
jgi:hypothetical protein